MTKRRKVGFVATVVLSLSAVFSASVTTFAWFQATSSATITTSPTSTTISVNKPDDYTFYAYKGNKKYDYNDDGVINSSDFNGATGTFTSDFIALATASQVNTFTNFSEMSPGDIYVFALGVEGASGVSLTLDKIISNNVTKEGNNKAIAGSPLANGATGANGVKYYTKSASTGIGAYDDGTYHYTYADIGSNIVADAANKYYPLTQIGGERYVYNTANHKLNIGYAIDIFSNTYTPTNGNYPTGYSYFVTSNEGKTSAGSSVGTDLFDYDVGTTSHRTILDSGTAANPLIDLSSNKITFFNNSLTSTNDFYIIWSVVYSEADEVLYDEVSQSDPTVLMEPAEGNRYFKQNDDGTSNCYGGLTFALSLFTLTIS